MAGMQWFWLIRDVLLQSVLQENYPLLPAVNMACIHHSCIFKGLLQPFTRKLCQKVIWWIFLSLPIVTLSAFSSEGVGKPIYTRVAKVQMVLWKSKIGSLRLFFRKILLQGIGQSQAPCAENDNINILGNLPIPIPIFPIPKKNSQLVTVFSRCTALEASKYSL